MAISGPFGTFGALTWRWRTLYWAICVGVPWLFLASALELTLTGRSWRRSAVVAFVVGANLVVVTIIVATIWSLEGGGFRRAGRRYRWSRFIFTH